jgi:phosphohistidine phosphatase
MRRLILLRHGKAESVSATGGDFDRCLTERGRRDCALIGRALAEAGVRPDLALVSAARRAQETWEEVAHAFPNAQVETVRGLYLAAPEQIAAAVRAVDENLCVIVVGHNPGLHELALELADGVTPPAGLESYPTAAAAVFRVARDGQAELEQILTPRDVGGGPT